MDKKQSRIYANHWEWWNKQRKELGIVEDWLESMCTSGESAFTSPRFGPHPNNAPDCIVLNKNGENVAVELCELVSEEAVAENQRGNAVYRDWQPTEVVNKIGEILKKKDKKTYHDGPYSEIIILIHTAEPVIAYEHYKELLSLKGFQGLHQVNQAYLLFKNHNNPSITPYPYIKLCLKES